MVFFKTARSILFKELVLVDYLKINLPFRSLGCTTIVPYNLPGVSHS